MKEPDINDKKYKYFHKKLVKIMLDNERYFRDVKKWKQYQLTLNPKTP